MQSLDRDDLAQMTLLVAYEVDLRLAGSASNSDIFLRLGERLSEVADSTRDDEPTFLYADPKTIEVFVKAAEDLENTQLKNVSQLSDIIERISEPLKSGHGVTNDQLATIKRFCLSLHRSLSASSMESIDEWEILNGQAAFD